MTIQRQKRAFTILHWVVMLFIAGILNNCANESAPQGGKKDVDPPKPKHVNPQNKSLHFSENKIQITFNEFIKEGSFAQTLISPPLDKRPDFKVNGRTLTVKLKSKLRDSTTYTINFAEDIKDLNEGNVANNFVYVFSTGDFIDSQKIVGRATLAKDNSPADGVVISLYPADSIDAITRSKPFYFAKTDKQGLFKINNIKAGVYRIYGLKDQNYNYIYDQPNEMIAFNDSIVVLKDSTIPNVLLNLFSENKGKTSLANVKSISPGLIQIAYTKSLESFKLESDLGHEGGFTQFSANKDTVLFWFSKYYEKNGTVFLVANDTLFDTSTITLKYIDRDSFIVNTYNALSIVNQKSKPKQKGDIGETPNIQEAFKPLKINFNRPVVRINEAKQVLIHQDSVEKPFPAKFTIDDSTKQFMLVDFDKKENTGYTLEIPDSTLKDVFGFWNVRLTYSFKVAGKDGYGNFHLTLRSEHPEKKYILKLLNSNDELVQTLSASGDSVKKVTIEHVLAGTYKFIAIDDANGNGKWDTGNFKRKRQPEKVITFKDTYALKGGWDMDVEVKF